MTKLFGATTVNHRRDPFAAFVPTVLIFIIFSTASSLVNGTPLAASLKDGAHFPHHHAHPYTNNGLNCSSNTGKKSLFLWSVDSPTQQNARSFLFGTIHVSYNEVWDYVSDKVKEVFGEAESIVFELELHNPDTIEILLQCKNLDGRRSLQELLPASVFERLKAYMRRFKYRLMQWSYKKFHNKSRHEVKKDARRLYNNIVGGWEFKKPVWLLFLLYQMSESFNQNETTPMLDVFLAQKAQELGKKLHSIETPAEQCNPLFSISEEQIVFAINYTLSYLEWIETRKDLEAEINDDSTTRKKSKSSLGELIQHYRCGSLEASVFNAKRFVQNGFSISPEVDNKAKQIDNLLVEDIILKRNVRMASRANDLLKQSPSTAFFFALGAGHFLGENSLISALEEYGYQIAPVKEEDNVIYLREQNMRFAKERSRFNELWVRELSTKEQQHDNLRHSLYEDIGRDYFAERGSSPQISISLYEVPNVRDDNSASTLSSSLLPFIALLWSVVYCLITNTFLPQVTLY